MTEFAVLRRFYGVDPARLTVKEYFGYVSRLGEIAAAESGTTDHTAAVTRMRERQLERD